MYLTLTNKLDLALMHLFLYGINTKKIPKQQETESEQIESRESTKQQTHITSVSDAQARWEEKWDK